LPQHPKISGKARHEPLECGAELGWIEKAEEAAGAFVAGHAVLEREETAQERLFRLGEQCRVYRALAAARDRAQGDHQKVVEVRKPALPVHGSFSSFQQTAN